MKSTEPWADEYFSMDVEVRGAGTVQPNALCDGTACLPKKQKLLDPGLIPQWDVQCSVLHRVEKPKPFSPSYVQAAMRAAGFKAVTTVEFDVRHRAIMGIKA